VGSLTRAALDPADLQILLARLRGVAEEMGAVLRRAAVSPNIKERADCSAAVFDAAGELLGQAEHIPVHLGALPASVRAAIDALGHDVGPDDHLILNDPFAGGTHLNDITLVTPCWQRDPGPGEGRGGGPHGGGRLVGWVANRAHHADVGGSAPGSMPAGATEIFQEGLRIPPVRLGPAVIALVAANSRTPGERLGDLAAQVGANVVGAERLAAVLAGDPPLEEVLAYGERRMRAALAALPDGRWRFADVLDSSGPEPGQRAPTPVVCTVEIRGDAITFDFTESGPQAPGSTNAVEAVTHSAVGFALRAVLDPTMPANGGSLRPVTIRVRPASVVAAAAPAAVGAGNVEASQRVADVCLGALATVAPDRVPAASQGTMGNVLVGGAGFVFYETIGGGQGGRPDRGASATAAPAAGRAGMNGVHTAMTNSRNTPVEAIERAFPVRVRRYGLRPGSGGTGRFAGGDGIERTIEFLAPATLTLVAERQSSRPWGLAGGGPGAPGEHWLLPGGDEAAARRLPDKVTLAVAAGDVVRVLTPGGGGWGEPAKGIDW
jgi:N-methylhydantoinase B/oxoprolinase/acetone carboxylase alpha subunit